MNAAAIQPSTDYWDTQNAVATQSMDSGKSSKSASPAMSSGEYGDFPFSSYYSLLVKKNVTIYFVISVSNIFRIEANLATCRYIIKETQVYT